MKCYHCGKGVLFGRSHTHHRGVAGGRWKKRAPKTKRLFKPNLIQAYIKENGKVKGGLQMSNPSQKIKFNLSEKEISDSNYHKGKHQQVEYWNYDYPGVLHYKANALCVNVDKTTKEARFMFQIPNGWPGLTGLYVVSYAKDINQKRKPDLYGHSATSDLAIATTWCETGIGFSPTMYPVTKGEVEVK